METPVQEHTPVARQMFTARVSRSVLLSPPTKHLVFLPNHRGDRAPAQCLLNKVVPVEPFAFDGKKEFAGLHGARIDGISLGRSAPVVLAGRRQEFADAGEKKFHAVFPAVPAVAALLQS